MNESSSLYLRNLIHEKSGIMLDEQKNYLLETRLNPVCVKNQIRNIDDLVLMLKQSPNNKLLENQILDAMTTNETLFFRDRKPFLALEKDVMPDLILKRRSSRTLNIWSAACSSGQEIFSFCMMIREYFPDLLSWKLDLLATDLSDDILEKAKRGQYSQLEINRGLPAPLLVKFFTKKDNDWFINENIKEMVKFKKMNFVEPWPPIQKMDLIFMRNVLIYFDTETKKQIIGNVKKNLQEDGYLLLGGTESLISVDQTLQKKELNGVFFYTKYGS